MKINNFLILALILINLSCVTANSERQYRVILKEIRSGDFGFSFIKLKNYLREYPDSIHKPEIIFAMAEYFFQIKDYHDSIDELTRYILDYPEDKGRVFAQAILYKIFLEYKDEPLLSEAIKESFFSKSLFLVFSESKIKYYTSALNNAYKIVEYVDKIEVFKNNEPFFKITP